jgi:hypothetical protein
MGYPNLIAKNQFGEPQNLFITGGSNQLDINFIVDHTNGNGLGIRSLKSQGQNPNVVKNVFMNTSASPAAGSPNPLPGFIIVQFDTGYTGYYGGYDGEVSPLSGSNISISAGVTQGQAYVITSVGTTTPAQWQAIGFPVGLTPAPGAAFIASVTGNGVGSGVVQVPSVSGTTKIEAVGDANQTSNPSAGNGGAYIILQCLSATAAGNTALEAKAPADGTVIGLRFTYAGPQGQPTI